MNIEYMTQIAHALGVKIPFQTLTKIVENFAESINK